MLKYLWEVQDENAKQAKKLAIAGNCYIYWFMQVFFILYYIHFEITLNP